MATELSDWFLHKLGISAHILCVVKFKDGGEVLTSWPKQKIVALLENETPKKHKKSN